MKNNKTEINLHWATYIKKGVMDAKILDLLRNVESQSVFELSSRAGPNDDFEYKGITVLEKTLERACNDLIPGEKFLISSELEQWGGGYSAGLRRVSSNLVGVTCIEEQNHDPEVQADRSGAICLHDPRAGAGNTFTPGLPFGRPLTIRLSPADFVIFPAWLRWSIFPVHNQSKKVIISKISIEACV